MNPAQGGWIIVLSLVVAMMLSVAHLPQWMPTWTGWLRPEWVALVYFFWVVAVPERVGMILAWIVGLFVDVLVGEPLGVNGLCFATITFVGWSLYERIRMYSDVQQGALLFLLVLAIGIFKGITQSFTSDTPFSLLFVLPAITTTIVWFPAAVLLRAISQQFAVR